MAKKVLIFFLFLGCMACMAQTRKRHFRQKEVGLFGGASYYIGDINPRTHALYSAPAAGAFFRVAMSYRYAFRFGANYGRVWGKDALSKDPNQLERGLSFRSDIYEAHAFYEFNFVDYRIGQEKLYFSMFLFAGAAGYYMNPQADYGQGYVNLNTMNSEGQSYSNYQFALPFGVGIKWNITEQIGLGFEWGPRRLFTDYLDDVSRAWPTNAVSTAPVTGEPGTMRGNPRSKDWYFFYGFTAQIRLPNRMNACPATKL
jgi:hypothetical protein